MRFPLSSILIFCLAVLLSACTGDASKMASEQPRAHDMSVLKVGTLRHRVIAEFGTPVLAEVENGTKVDVFRFVDGYSTAARTSRSFLHGAMNIGTFGLWDIIGKPVESGFSGNDVKVKVEYDTNDRISYVKRYE